MTETTEISIFDEIVNCGILEEDSVVNFGAGHKDGQFLETLLEYNGTFQKGLVKAVDPDPKKIKTLTKKFKDENLEFFETSLQSYIDNEPEKSDWIVLSGVFNSYLYGENQYDYVKAVIENCLPLSNKGIIVSIKENISEEFSYSMLFFFIYLDHTYGRFTYKKVLDGNHIFCIFK